MLLSEYSSSEPAFYYPNHPAADRVDPRTAKAINIGLISPFSDRTIIEIDKSMASWMMGPEGLLWRENRPRHVDHVNKIAQDMKVGDFSAGCLTFAMEVEDAGGPFLTEKSVPYLVDGEHRIWAIEQSGIAQTFFIKLEVRHSYAEIGDLYQTLGEDKKRSKNDQRNANASTRSDDLSQISRHDWSNLLGAMSQVAPGMHQMGMNGEQRTATKNLKFMKRLIEVRFAKGAVEFCNILNTCSESGFKSKASRVSIFALGMVTMEQAPEKAREFWEPFFNPQTYEGESHPVERARDYIKTVEGKGHFAYEMPALVRAWNAFVDNQRMDKPLQHKSGKNRLIGETEALKQFYQYDYMLRIKGTHYNGVTNPDFATEALRVLSEDQLFYALNTSITDEELQHV